MMNKNVMIVLGGGFLIAILVAMIVQAGLRGSRVEPVEREDHLEILVAARDLSEGITLRDSDMRWQSWPKGSVFSGAVVRKDTETPLDVVSGRLRRSIGKDEPVLLSALVPETGSFLAASLPHGMRAMAIEVNAMRMAGGFIGPGDFVDVVLVYRARIETEREDHHARQIVNENLDRFASETILQNVMVVGVDQTAKREKDDAKVARTVTLAVSREQAEKLFLATEMGTLNLALRGIGDDEQSEPDWPVITDLRMTRIARELYEEFSRRYDKKPQSESGVVRVYDGENLRHVLTR